MGVKVAKGVGVGVGGGVGVGVGDGPGLVYRIDKLIKRLWIVWIGTSVASW